MWVAIFEIGLNYLDQAGLKRTMLATRDQLQLVPQLALPQHFPLAIEVSKRS